MNRHPSLDFLLNTELDFGIVPLAYTEECPEEIKFCRVITEKYYILYYSVSSV